MCDVPAHSSAVFRVQFRPTDDQTYYSQNLECFVSFKSMRTFRLVGEGDPNPHPHPSPNPNPDPNPNPNPNPTPSQGSHSLIWHHGKHRALPLHAELCAPKVG